MNRFNGLLLIDKPKFISSFDVIKKIRKMSGIKKIGHAGTLDPLASGLMIVCLGDYTKLCGHLTADDKIYETTFCLGKTTTTDDAGGQIIAEHNIEHLDIAVVQTELNKFVGEIQQVPPQFSAIKINGERAYKLARKNEEVELKARTVNVFSIEVNEITLPLLKLTIHCSKGTYIRSIARDLGNILKVGGYALEICRIKSGDFNILNAVSLDDLTKENLQNHLLVGKSAVAFMEAIEITLEEKQKILLGVQLARKVFMKNEIAMLCFEDELVALASKENEHAKLLRVL